MLGHYFYCDKVEIVYTGDCVIVIMVNISRDRNKVFVTLT